MITAHPQPAGNRVPAVHHRARVPGAVHIEDAEAIETTIRRKLSQHAGLTDPLVIVLDLSSPLIDDSQIAATLYGPAEATMFDPDTVLSVTRDRTKGIWPQPLPQPPRPAPPRSGARPARDLARLTPANCRTVAAAWHRLAHASGAVEHPDTWPGPATVTAQATTPPAADYLK